MKKIHTWFSRANTAQGFLNTVSSCILSLTCWFKYFWVILLAIWAWTWILLSSYLPLASNITNLPDITPFVNLLSLPRICSLLYWVFTFILFGLCPAVIISCPWLSCGHQLQFHLSHSASPFLEESSNHNAEDANVIIIMSFIKSPSVVLQWA